jgi:hypothetical protein
VRKTVLVLALAAAGAFAGRVLYPEMMERLFPAERAEQQDTGHGTMK